MNWSNKMIVNQNRSLGIPDSMLGIKVAHSASF